MDAQCDILPDYPLTTAEAYTKFAELLIARGLAVLLFANVVENGGRLTEALPSWIPDLRNCFSDSADPLGIMHISGDNFEAASLGNGMLSCSLFALGTLDEVYEMDSDGFKGVVRWQAKIRSFKCVITALVRPESRALISIEEGDEVITVENVLDWGLYDDFRVVAKRQ